jgi:oxygen-independent coproporphyrinogen-3 oxidase
MEVVADFNSRTRDQFSFAHYGFQLDHEEQKRRYVLKSLLRRDGLSFADYHSYCGSEAFEDLPQLSELLWEGLAERNDGNLVLTAEGLALSDVIGPWLWSDVVRERMGEFALR